MRRSIIVDGFRHGDNPVPAACVVGNILMSGAIFGIDPETGKLADSVEAQCTFMFAILGDILAAGRCGLEDVVKMTFFLQPDVPRELINVEWVKAFPDETSRPARHVIVSQTLSSRMFMQCDVTAIVKGNLL